MAQHTTWRRARHVLLSIGLLTIAATSVYADVIVDNSLMQQSPPIAYANQPYSFNIATNTFRFSVPSHARAPPSPPSIVYSTSSLPPWLTFNPDTMVLSGVAPAVEQDNQEQYDTVAITGALSSDTAPLGGNSSATDSFPLLILDAAAPRVKVPLTEQFPQASSLGPANMIDPTTVRLPLGWSFSIGLRGDTFAIGDSTDVYWTATLSDGSPLPSWLIFSRDTYDFYGNAPTDVQSQGKSFKILVTGSSRAGYGGATQTFTLAVSPHSLTLNKDLSSINGSVGAFLQHSIPIDHLRADGSPLSSTSELFVTAALDDPALSWLSLDQSARTLFGTVPYEPYGNASSLSHVQVPITFAGANNTKITVNQTISITPSAFVGLVLPNVFMSKGNSINVALAQYLRNTSPTRKRSSSWNRSKAIRRAPASAPQTDVNVALTPSNAAEWLTYDEQTKTLAGQVPQDWTDRVKVDMTAHQNPGNTLSKANFFLAFDGDNAVGYPTNNGSATFKPDENKGGSLSQRSKVAIGASLGAAAGLALIILLLCCCRRRNNGHQDEAPASRVRDDDEGTLTDKSRTWKKAMVIGRTDINEVHTPSTVAVSPMPGFDGEKMAFEKSHGMTPPKEHADLHSVVVVSPNGRRRDVLHEVEAPIQSRLIANLFTGGRAHPQGYNGSDRKRRSREQSTGLGLTLGDDPFRQATNATVTTDSHGRIRHQRSRESVNSHRSSWESDLFYEDAPSTQQHHSDEAHAGHDNSASSENNHDVPRRRGKSTATALNVRHRNTHINESPAFVTSDVFTPSGAPTSSHSLDQVGMSAMASSTTIGSEFLDSETGVTAPSRGAGNEQDARILQARVMQVQRHSPMLHQGANNPVKARATAARPYDTSSNPAGAFDDAEDDMEWTYDSAHDATTSSHRADARGDKRNSALSAMTDTSQFAGVRAHFAREAQMEAQGNAQPASFDDAASISGMDPRETMKPIQSRPRSPPSPKQSWQKSRAPPQTPPASKHTRGSSSAGSAASGRFLPCPTVNAVMGHLLRFHLYPNVPPPIAGAPSSPGKRSGKVVRYELVMDDDRPHLLKYKGRWPAMLSEWLSINVQTFEVDGVVPRAAELEQLGDCQIALISTQRSSGESPSKRASTSSYDSASGRPSSLHGGDEERAVVARAKLVFQNAAPRGYAPRLGQAF